MTSKKTYPIGSTWQGTNEDGMIGTIILHNRDKFFETWRWYKRYSDGSIPNHYSSDWRTSYRACHEEMNLYNRSTGKTVRLKRIK